MASFGLLFYGPLQHRWYGLLASRFPGTSTPNFLAKVRLTQASCTMTTCQQGDAEHEPVVDMSPF